MEHDRQSVKIAGIGSHQIDIEALDHEVRERLVECIKKNGKISIMVGSETKAGSHRSAFAQSID